MMHTLFSNRYWVMREDDEHQLVDLQRTRSPFESRLDAAVEEDRIRAALAPRHKTYGIIVDLRLLTGDSSAKAEAGLTRLFAAIARRFARVAVLHSESVDLERIFSATPPDGAETLLTANDNAAQQFARFGTSPAAVDVPSHIRQRIPTENPIDEALHWARELEEWALPREKVIADLDVRGAKAARGLARELRRLHALLRVVGSGERAPQGPGPILNELGVLRKKAVELMFLDRASRLDGGRRTPVVQSALAAETLRPTKDGGSRG